jgi:hypothetical protein
VSTLKAEDQRAVPVLRKLTLGEKLQNLLYSVLGAHAGVALVSAVYVLVLQAKYFGFSLKYSWDHLPQAWHMTHLKVLGWSLGPWLEAHWTVARHYFGRNIPEGVVGLSIILIILAKAKPVTGQPSWLDRLFVRLGFPSHYQGMMGRHERASGLQIVLLPVTMLIAALPGVIVSSVVIFGGTALLHRYGYHLKVAAPPRWTVAYTAGSVWQPLVIGAFGGWFFARKSVSKVADDVQLHFLEIRLAVAYAADEILQAFRDGGMTLAAARDALTRMKRTEPVKAYPPVYRIRYQALLAAEVRPEAHGRGTTILMAAVLVILPVLTIYGLYVRYWGAKHGLWVP